MGDNERQPRFISGVKIPMSAECLMNYFLAENGELMRHENDEVLAHFIETRKDSLTVDYRKSVLLEIDHCLYQLQRKRLSWPNLSPSDVLIMKSKENTTSDTTENITALLNIYCFVLTDGEITEYYENLQNESDRLKCSDPDIALNLMGQMNGEDFSIEDVLRHPFHWTDHKKILFICQAFDLIKHEIDEKEARTEIEKRKKVADDYGLYNTVGVIPEDRWFNKLKLTIEEQKEIDQTPILKGQSSVAVNEDVIYDKGFKNNPPLNEDGTPKAKPIYDENSIFDLMRFFRNCYAHYWENGRDVRLAFGSYLSGYWKFYSRRYPKLFMHVYRIMMPHMRDNEAGAEYITRGNYLPALPAEPN